MNPEVIACIVCCAAAAVGGFAVMRAGVKQPQTPKLPVEKREVTATDKAK